MIEQRMVHVSQKLGQNHKMLDPEETFERRVRKLRPPEEVRVWRERIRFLWSQGSHDETAPLPNPVTP